MSRHMSFEVIALLTTALVNGGKKADILKQITPLKHVSSTGATYITFFLTD